jgi:tRNA U38,U39,U40 pseudouridine synthase TruA
LVTVVNARNVLTPSFQGQGFWWSQRRHVVGTVADDTREESTGECDSDVPVEEANMVDEGKSSVMGAEMMF